ncbi:uncharacterized protein LOC144170675 [Haemaphysalis longicornis]|uniref:Uncharacterized protein n=1 Tax=Haemaphysalis longicornis TaxID=44386 RepID=A0A9J6G235_HAELO|nr:hypothetical protein HPB48_019695 [Haemaphysalis longicornis]
MPRCPDLVRRPLLSLLFLVCCTCSGARAMCPSRCLCDDENLRVVCDSAYLDVVPITLNPNLRELSLVSNHIKSGVSSFSVYANLRYLDVSNNQLVSLGKENFHSHKHLVVLVLARNMISQLDNTTFSGLDELQTLLLNENYIDNIPAGVFAPLRKLEKLDLSQNRLVRITEQAFQGLSRLKTLLLRDNKFVTIPSQAFVPLTSVLNLDLGLNMFSNIPEEAFVDLKQLEELSLDGCGVKTVQSGAFRQLSALRQLKLHDNELEEVPTATFQDIPRLEGLNLGQNKFPRLRSKAFQYLKYLRTLEVSGSAALRCVDKGAFTENADLETIRMTHNVNFRCIELGAFDGLAGLKRLILRGNGFTTLQESLLEWDTLQELDLRDNPLVCNCSVLWLWQMCSVRNATYSPLTPETSPVRCGGGPAGLKDKLLRDLVSSDLGCYDAVLRRQIIIGVVAAAAIVFALIVALGFRFRERVAGVLKNKWGSGTKEPQYHKTHGEDDNSMCQVAHQPLKLIPVTEL